ncbi:hypothetical protein EV121DRAFT_274906, partial [Schizophyllum commune]
MDEDSNYLPAQKRQRTALDGAARDIQYLPPPHLDDTDLIRMPLSVSPAPTSPPSVASSNAPSPHIHTSEFVSLTPTAGATPSQTVPSSATVPPSAPSTVPAEFSHMSAEEYETYEICVAMQEALKAGKTSANNYSRHIAAYEKYWLQYQHMRYQDDANHTFQPAHPITATKVAIFLKYECERPKRSSEHEGGTAGVESIKQCISALERHRSTHQHELAYSQCEEAKRPLRSDARIKQFEISKKASEPQRIMSGEKSKATGTSSDTYTVDELKQASMWCLKDRKTAASLLLG